MENRNGEIMWEHQKVLERWRQYCEELYAKETEISHEQRQKNMQYELEPNILVSEIKEAIKHPKLNKSPGMVFPLNS